MFLLFLDCVFQMQRQFFRAFEFGSEYLVHLLDASLSGECGTFLFDCEKQRVDAGVYDLCESVWTRLASRADELRNPHFLSGGGSGGGVVLPSSNLALLELWSALFLRLDVGASHEKDRFCASLLKQLQEK